jgi:8-oxo-dGTP diphosphatase
MEKTEIFFYKPIDFLKPLLVAGGVLHHEDRFLLLKRHPEKPYGLHWNLPAGKIEHNEDPHIGAQREIHEETGIFVPLENLKPLHIFYIKREHTSIQFYIFEATFEHRPSIALKMDENTEALWTSHEEALKLPLLGGGEEILNFCLKKSLS